MTSSEDDGAGEHLRNIVRSLQIGQAVKIDLNTLEEAYPGHPMDGFFERGTAIDKLLAGIVGSNWTILADQSVVDGAVTFRRVAETGKRWNVDPDRRHLFEQMPDGSFEPARARASA